MKFGHRDHVVRCGAWFIKHRQGGVEVDAYAFVVYVPPAQLVLIADVVIDSCDGMVRVVVIRRGERQQSNRYVHAVYHRDRIGWIRCRGHGYIFLKYTQIGFTHPRHAVEYLQTSRGRGIHGLPRVRTLTERIVLEVAEVEQFVFLDWAPNSGAQPVVVETRIGPLSGADDGGVIHGIEIAVLEVLINGAVQLVCAGLHNHVEDASRCAAEFGVELILLNIQLGNRLVGNIDLGTGVVAAVVGHTVNVEAVVFRALSGDAGSRALADAALRGHAGPQQAEIVDSRAIDYLRNTRHRQINRLFGIERGLNLRGAGIDRRG